MRIMYKEENGSICIEEIRTVYLEGREIVFSGNSYRVDCSFRDTAKDEFNKILKEGFADLSSYKIRYDT